MFSASKIPLCFLLLVIVLSVGCVTPTLPEKSTTPEKAEYLNWSMYPNHPAKFEVERASQLNELDNIILYFSLSNTTLDASELAYYFPEYAKASDEFERRDVAQIISQKIDAKKKILLSQEYFVAKIDRVRIGEYSFTEQGFPLLNRGDERGMKFFATLPDHTTSMDAVLKAINEIFKKEGNSDYSALNSFVEFDNILNKSINFTLVSVDETTAKRIVSEFGYYEDPSEKGIAEAFGKPYKGYKTAIAFVLYKPISAKAEKSDWSYIRFERKEVHGIAKYIVLATQQGTVFGVYPPQDGN